MSLSYHVDSATCRPLDEVARSFKADVKVAYFVHDLSDPSVHRRVRMLLAGGASVVLFGFRRSADAVDAVEGVRTIDLGRTRNAKLAQRAVSVAKALTGVDRLAEELRGVDAVLARNLEMLLVGARARKRHAPRVPLIYECLDIHRLLLSSGVAGSILRRFESRLWREVDLLLTSSPAFLRNYFEPRGFPAAVRLVENKVLWLGRRRDADLPPARPPGPPWRIGWFGMIRCRKSLDILRSLARRADGGVEVIIRGRPSDAVFPDFAASIAGSPHIRFAGLYRNPQDLPSIYGEVHFNWVVDYFEDGQNSSWLLPNRIYEGGMLGAVPIALAHVETANWLTRQGAGVVVREPLEENLAGFFGSLDPAIYSRFAAEIAALPRRNLVDGPGECRELVRAMCGGIARPGIGRRYLEAPA
jgi:hypothetical protein